MCKDINISNNRQKIAIATLLAALLAFPTITFAADELIEIKTGSPYQVVPGTSIPIYVTVVNLGSTEIDINSIAIRSRLKLERMDLPGDEKEIISQACP